MKLCIIPARGGSKRIPRKNVRDFCGKPIIAWSIEAAIQSCCFDEVIVSTDDEEIASLARKLGAQTPFKRPAELSDDYTGTIPVIAQAIQHYVNNGYRLEAVCCLYATAPFVRASDLIEGYNMLKTCKKNSFVFAATEFSYPIQRAFLIDEITGTAKMINPRNSNVRSQDLEPRYHDAGQFYWGRQSAWLQSREIIIGSKPFLLPQMRVQDIDSEADWRYAELKNQILFREAK